GHIRRSVERRGTSRRAQDKYEEPSIRNCCVHIEPLCTRYATWPDRSCEEWTHVECGSERTSDCRISPTAEWARRHLLTPVPGTPAAPANFGTAFNLVLPLGPATSSPDRIAATRTIEQEREHVPSDPASRRRLAAARRTRCCHGAATGAGCDLAVD